MITIKSLSSGIHRGSSRQAFLVALYFLEEKQEEEGDGVLLFLQLRQISCRTAQLYRHPCP